LIGAPRRTAWSLSPHPGANPGHSGPTSGIRPTTAEARSPSWLANSTSLASSRQRPPRRAATATRERSGRRDRFGWFLIPAPPRQHRRQVGDHVGLLVPTRGSPADGHHQVPLPARPVRHPWVPCRCEPVPWRVSLELLRHRRGPGPLQPHLRVRDRTRRDRLFVDGNPPPAAFKRAAEVVLLRAPLAGAPRDLDCSAQDQLGAVLGDPGTQVGPLSDLRDR